MTDIALKNEPRHGYYPWWPEDGNDWLYPDDIELARQLIPSMRVFRREGEQAPYVVLHYGELRLRVLRTLWQEVSSDGFELGDWVEVLTRGGQNAPRTATIREMVWDERARALSYQLLDNGQPIAKFYTAEDLRHVEPTLKPPDL